MEAEASKAVGAWDVVEGKGGEVVTSVDREGVEKGTMIDEGYDVIVTGVVGGHEHPDVGAGFGDCCCERFLWSALGEDGNSEVCADYLRNWGWGVESRPVDGVVESEGIKIGKGSEDCGTRTFDVVEVVQIDCTKTLPIGKASGSWRKGDSAEGQILERQPFDGFPERRQRPLAIASTVVEIEGPNARHDLEPLPRLRGVLAKM